MESIEGACCSEPPTSSPSTRIAVLVDFMGKIIALSLGQQCRTAPGVLVWSMGFCADVPASALDGGL